MTRPRTETKPPTRTKRAASTWAIPGVETSPGPWRRWPEGAHPGRGCRLPAGPRSDAVRMVGPRGLPGRLIGSEWRFSKTALDQWLRTPPGPSTKESLLALTGAWKDDPDAEATLKEIYRQRGRPMTPSPPPSSTGSDKSRT